jgi:hypothetical protein
MRLSWVIAVFLFQASTSNSILAVGPPKESALNWQAPFTVLSAENPDSKLVLMLVTNDDAFYKYPAAANKPVAGRLPGVAQQAGHVYQGWCAAEFHRTCEQVLKLRPDLKDKISLQSVLAGTPSELSGGHAHTSPKRVVCFLCDKHYKLLALSIGIPNADDLLTLIEDAQEVKILAGLNGTNTDQMSEAIVQRSKKRLGRHWNMKLREVVEVKEQADALIRAGAVEPAPTVLPMRKLVSALQPTYNYDAQTRFGLSTGPDARRLIILEQHSETRYSWCQTILPFIAGMDVQLNWHLFVELLWQQCAVTAGGDQTDFLRWFDEQKTLAPFVMAVEPPSHVQHLPWPPTVVPKNRRGTSWHTTHDAATEFSFRTINTEQLTALVRKRDLQPIAFFSPSMIRYLFVSPNNRLPHLIRENDPPARFLGLLRRTKAADQSTLQPILKEKIR